MNLFILGKGSIGTLLGYSFAQLKLPWLKLIYLTKNSLLPLPLTTTTTTTTTTSSWNKKKNSFKFPGFLEPTFSLTPITLSLETSLSNHEKKKESFTAYELHKTLVGSSSSMLPTLSSSSSHPLFQDHHIDYLMVTTKAHQTYSALLPWIQMGLLSNRSHILFLQNGIGHIDDVIQQGLLPFQLSPWLYLGITNHGAYRSFTTTTTSLTSSSLVHTSTLLSPSMTTSKERLIKKKEVTHSPTPNPVRTENSPVSPGQWWFSPYPFKAKEIHAPFLKKDPTSTSTWTSPLLHLCSKLPHSEVIPSEHMEGPWLQKFAMNCLVNPLTSMDHVQNGALLDSPCFKVYLDPLCEELTQVYQGTFPSLHTSHPLLLDPVHLSQRVQALCQLTSNNWSSMVMDLKAGQTTEIRYLTQTLLTWAQEARVKVPYHTFMYHQIKALERQHVKEGIRGTKRRD